MLINLSEQKIVDLMINDMISIEDIDISERTAFIKNKGSFLLFHYFKENKSYLIEKLLEYQTIEDVFIEEVRSFNKLASINYVEKLPENSFITHFILSMSKQNSLTKQDVFNKIYPLVIKYKEDFQQFFKIRLGENSSAFIKGQPIGMFFLRVFDREIEDVLNEGVIDLNLFSITTKDTLAHYLHQYSFEVNKSIIDKIYNDKLYNHEDFFKDKNNIGHTGIDKLNNDLRERNIQTLEYLFSNKLDLNIYKNEFLNYVMKSANILKNTQTKQSMKDRVLVSLNTLFNLPQLQNNALLKKCVAEKIANNGSVEIHYVWLQAKFPEKGIEEKRPKI